MRREAVFDFQGATVAWLVDQEALVCAKTQGLGFIDHDFVFTQDGRHLGELRNGYFWDREGRAVGFIAGAFGGPPRPQPRLSPLAPVLRVPRARARVANPPARLAHFSGWSAQSFAEYLDPRS